MKTLTWDLRCELAEEYAPRLVLFPEVHDLGRPGGHSPYCDHCQRGEVGAPYEDENHVHGDYHPRSVGVLLQRGQLYPGFRRALRQLDLLAVLKLNQHGAFVRRLPPAVRRRFPEHRPPTLDALGASTHPTDQLDQVGVSILDPEYAWETYFGILDSVDGHGDAGRERYPVTAYARVQTRAEALAACQREGLAVGDREVGRPFFQPDEAHEDDLSIQYWFCYYYDDWANRHEGDWEGITLLLRSSGASKWEPVGAGYNAHETGLRRHWADVGRARAGGTHPLVFVAAGSHASYFQHLAKGYVTTIPGKIIPFVNVRLHVNLTTDTKDHVPDLGSGEACEVATPRIEVLPSPTGADDGHPALRHAQWLQFPGTWGSRILGRFGHGGPQGPSHKGLKWHNPFAWVERGCKPDYLVY